MEDGIENLRAVEEPLESDLPICDAHHHLWERPPNSYLLSDFVGDLASGHNVVATVAVECGYGYRKSGADELRPLARPSSWRVSRGRVGPIRGSRQRWRQRLSVSRILAWAMPWRLCSKGTWR
jgi:hypothetical protein